MHLCDTGIFRSVWVAVWSALCLASGELTASMRHLYFSFCMVGCLVCYVPGIRRTYYIYATLVFFVLYGWLSGLLCAYHQEHLLCLCDTGISHCWSAMCPASGELSVSMRHWYFSFCMGGCLVCFVPSIRRTYCIYAILVFFVLYGWLSDLLCA